MGQPGAEPLACPVLASDGTPLFDGSFQFWEDDGVEQVVQRLLRNQSPPPLHPVLDPFEALHKRNAGSCVLDVPLVREARLDLADDELLRERVKEGGALQIERRAASGLVLVEQERPPLEKELHAAVGFGQRTPACNLVLQRRRDHR